MEELSKSQKARMAIRTFKIHADSLTLQGAYKPSGRAGEKLAESLRLLSPEIYGSMTDLRIVELKGLEYVIDRMPKGIENCTRIILTAQEDFQETSFEKIIPLKRRRVSYAVSKREMCFVITRGQSEIYDILTHITFLGIEAKKIYQQAFNRVDDMTPEWAELERVVTSAEDIEGEELDQAIWNLSIILGRTYKETRETYEYLEHNRLESKSNSSLFEIIYGIGMRVRSGLSQVQNELTVYFTPSLHEMIGHHRYASLWAIALKKEIYALGLQDRSLHVISANMHSVRNLLYGAGALKKNSDAVPDDLYDMVRCVRDKEELVVDYAGLHGFVFHKDESGANIDVNIIDLSKIEPKEVHPALNLCFSKEKDNRPVIIIVDYSFGTQAFDIMDEFLSPSYDDKRLMRFDVKSISIMGKAGVLPGKKGDIMLATAHVLEGTPHNYIVKNDLSKDDFDGGVDVYSGPMVTVLGTSLQNRDMLDRFHSSSWKAVGLEMEGGHFQRAISGAIIQEHIPPDMNIRYAYYASDNPLLSGQTLASGPMGEDGIVPTYMISKVILEKIVNNHCNGKG
jgi:hypothetical protein